MVEVKADKEVVAEIRAVDMTVSRIDPLSAVKISFLLSVAVGIMIIISSIVLWLVLDSMHVWQGIAELFTVLNSEQLSRLGQFFEFGRLVPFSIVVAVVETVLLTVLGGVMALVFNVITGLVGGLRVTVTDE